MNFSALGIGMVLTCGVAINAPPGLAAEPKTDLMVARPCKKPCYQTWTLTSRLGHILESYEKLIGPRNRAYRLLGVEFNTSNRPRTWYPDFGNGMRSVIVQLTEKARHNQALALFQLGHEVFHLIEPVKPDATSTYFEEGLASYLAVDYMKSQKYPAREARQFLTEKSYRSAYEMVAQLAALHDDFYPRVRRFREVNKSFSDVRADAIRAAFPKTPALVAKRLAQPFTAGAMVSAQ